MCLRGAASPESGWIFYTFFKVHRHFCVFSCIPASVCQCHCPRRDVAVTVRMVDWYPLTRSSLSPLSRWHRDTKCEPTARQADYYYTLLPTQARGVAAPWRLKEKRREERRLVTTRRNTSGQKEESWEEESETLNHKIWLIYPISIIHPRYYSNTDVYVCFPTIYNKGEYKSYFRMIN